jgi:hypothetical protein
VQCSAVRVVFKSGILCARTHGRGADVDLDSGVRTHSLAAVPVYDGNGLVIGVLQVLPLSLPHSSPLPGASLQRCGDGSTRVTAAVKRRMRRW